MMWKHELAAVALATAALVGGRIFGGGGSGL